MSRLEVTIVEDDEAMRQALTRLLRTAGFDVRAFASAEDVLHTDPSVSSRCFVIDIRLPGLPGIQLYERLTEAGQAAPVIFVTAHDDPAVRGTAERMGCAAFLAKPFAGETLIGAIEHATGHARSV